MICTGVAFRKKTATFSFPGGLDVAAKEICQLCGGKMPVKKMGRKLYCSYECSMSVMKAAQAAARFVNVAVSRGYIPAAKHLVCVDCGAPAQAYDHRKYMQALNVDPVFCRRRVDVSFRQNTPSARRNCLSWLIWLLIASSSKKQQQQRLRRKSGRQHTHQTL